MKYLSLGLLFLLVTGCSSQQHLVGRQWHEIKTEHFDILTDGDPELVVSLAQDLERFRLVVASLTNSQMFGEDRLTIFAADGTSTYGALVGADKARNTGGLFWDNSYDQYAIVNLVGYNTGASDNSYWARKFLYHEYTHYILAAGSSISYPYWYEEGLAELFSTVLFDSTSENAVYFGYSAIDRNLSLNRHGFMQLDRLLAAKPGSLSIIDVDRLYATGWLLTHMLSTDPYYAQRLSAYLKKQSESFGNTRAIFEESFGATLEQIEARLREYLKKDVHTYRIEVDIEYVQEQPLVKPVEKPDVISTLGRFYALSPNGVEKVYNLRKQLDRSWHDRVDVDYSLVSAYLNAGREEEAGELMAEIAGSGYSSDWAKLVKAEWLRSQVDTFPEQRDTLLMDAYNLYKSVISEDQNNAVAWFGLAASASQLGAKPEIYAKYLGEAYFLKPRSKRIAEAYCFALAESENWRELVRVLRPIVRQTTDIEARLKLQNMLILAEKQLREEQG